MTDPSDVVGPSGEPGWPHHRLGRELSNWGRWGDDDEIGTLNLITAAKLVEAARLVRTGQVFDLGLPFDRFGPQSAGRLRSNPIHAMTMMPGDWVDEIDGMISTDDMIVMGLQVGTQWDSLAHVGYGGLFYNGMQAAEVDHRFGARRNSFDKAVGRLVSRGVLLDVAQLHGTDRLEDAHVVTSEDLTAAAAAQEVDVRPGDILCVRTGSVRWLLDGDAPHFMGPQPGLGLDTCRWLREHDVAAVVLDNAICEINPTPIPGVKIPFHQVAIRDVGLTLGEMFVFEALAESCRQDGCWEFLFLGCGLKVSGAVGSPATPLVIK